MRRVILGLLAALLIIGVFSMSVAASDHQYVLIVQLKQEVQPGKWLAFAPENQRGEQRIAFHVLLPRDGAYTPGQYVRVIGTYDPSVKPPVVQPSKVETDIPQDYTNVIDAPPANASQTLAEQVPHNPNGVSKSVEILTTLEGKRCLVRDLDTGEEYVAVFPQSDGTVIPRVGSHYSLLGEFHGAENGRRILVVEVDRSHDTADDF